MQIKQSGQLISSVDFGIVEVGTSKEVYLIVVNNEKGKLEGLTFSTTNKDVVVLSAPTSMAPNSESFLKLKWSPPVQATEPLKVEIKVKGKLIYV
jgi:hypothetical protein